MKRTVALAAFLLVTGAAFAQDKPATPPAGPIAIQDPLQITVSRQALQIIGQALMEIPYKTAAPVLQDLQNQLNKADQAATEDAKKLEAEKAKEPAKDQEKAKTAPAKDAK